ncbi:chloride channel protein [Paraburkholderia ginsengiterrae]|uniref:Chloride channel protein n=1 Tax=Paraburkholderia ginsengiterrae TaxID=1462993 RepID=A0A1A9N6D0_9BURK|nr:chloride channel protein [Paraburkholderia ginsengiterrae]OAJ59154.1 chloride channel protein [Paraburkholderia ginsengiterrae]
MKSSQPSVAPSKPLAFALVTLLTGVGAGLGGMALALLLHAVQHVAFGYSLEQLVGHESFLEGVSAASPLHRLAVLSFCGVVAGVGWSVLYRYGRPLVSIRKAVGSADPRMPFVSTIVHALLQIVTVALGSPLGREVAPREIGALFAGRLAHRAGLTSDDSRILVACGAGAGLAAVYNVPLGGAVFVLEVLLGTFAPRALIAAFITSTIAALVAWSGLGNEQQYVVPVFASSGPLLIWAAVCGPLFGLAAWGFVKLTSSARANAPRGLRLIALSVLNFAAIGALVMVFPQLAGNGKGAAALSFSGNLTIGLAAALLALKVAIEASSLRAGAEGGLLTPGLTNGALLAVVLGGVWSHFFPTVTPGACALIGAGAFLAASMQMPLTAVVLIAEFTHTNHNVLYPLLVAVGGSVMTFRASPVLLACLTKPACLPASADVLAKQAERASA